jgi:hypothetical protein
MKIILNKSENKYNPENNKEILNKIILFKSNSQKKTLMKEKFKYLFSLTPIETIDFRFLSINNPTSTQIIYFNHLTYSGKFNFFKYSNEHITVENIKTKPTLFCSCKNDIEDFGMTFAELEYIAKHYFGFNYLEATSVIQIEFEELIFEIFFDFVNSKY